LGWQNRKRDRETDREVERETERERESQRERERKEERDETKDATDTDLIDAELLLHHIRREKDVTDRELNKKSHGISNIPRVERISFPRETSSVASFLETDTVA
jgi:hypothetical protein